MIEIYARLNLTINLPNLTGRLLKTRSFLTITLFILKVPYQALKKGHHLVLLSFVVVSLAGIVAPILQSALFDVDISPADGTLWTAKVGTNMAYARALQAVRGVVIVLIITLAACCTDVAIPGSTLILTVSLHSQLLLAQLYARILRTSILLTKVPY